MKVGYYILVDIAGVKLRSGVFESDVDARCALDAVAGRNPTAHTQLMRGKAEAVYIKAKP